MVKKTKNPVARVAIDTLGVVLIVLSVLLGWLPGPGGIPLFLAGLGLLSIHNHWARRLLLDFELRRKHFSDTFLEQSRKISLTIDLFCVLAFITGLFVALNKTQFLWRGLGIGLISASLIIFLSNQKRLDRIIAKTKR